MIEVELPDGSIAEFPDGTPPEAMKKAIQKKFPVKPGMVEDAGRSFLSGLRQGRWWKSPGCQRRSAATGM